MSAAKGRKRKLQKNWGDVAIEVDRCKGCAFCVEFCPSGALELSESFNKKGYHPPELIDKNCCSGCDLCGLYCPDFAIHGWREGKNPNYEELKKKAG